MNVSGDFRKYVFFSKPELSAIIEELLSNACASMIQSEQKQLTMEISFNDTEARFALSDTGKGLKVDDSSEVFDRNYSTKPDKGGYGLYHARLQMQRYGGKINIRNNNKLEYRLIFTLEGVLISTEKKFFCFNLRLNCKTKAMTPPISK